MVAIGRVINDDNVFHAAPDTLHILHELPVEEGAVLAEQSLRGDPLRVEHVHQWDRILAQTCSEDDNFIILAHLNDKFAALRTNLNVDVASTTFDVDRENDVRLVSRSECGVHKRLINVEEQGLAPSERFSLWLKKVVPAWTREMYNQ